MLPMPSIKASALPRTADEHGESRQQKPKTLPCKYCNKRFRRVEHVQRHERTHTKEKPFSCGWTHCGKTFGRRDLLVRHEKLVHLNEGGKDAARPRKSSSVTAVGGPLNGPSVADPMATTPQPHQPQTIFPQDGVTPAVDSSLPSDQRLGVRTPAGKLDLLSDAATRLASAGEVANMQPHVLPSLTRAPDDLSRPRPYGEGIMYGSRSREQHLPVVSGGYANSQHLHSQHLQGQFDDYNLFLDDCGISPYFIPVTLDDEQSYGIWNRPLPEPGPRGQLKLFSAFPSRLPSLQPDPRDLDLALPRLHDESMRVPIWRISATDHAVIRNRLDEFSSVLPSDFMFPSRHTLTRFLEGYISGFHAHLPFLHIPTLSPVDLSPELLLALSAVGAQYRFETNRGHALWYAAKAVALEQIRRRHSHEVSCLLPPPAAYSPRSARPSPSSGLRHSFTSVHQGRPLTQDTQREPYSPNTPQSRLETMQALLLLFAVGLWGAKAILHDALSLQSLLALLVREEGLLAEPNHARDWESWIRLEAGNRTKLFAFCFFNLCSIAYNTPPLLVTSEVNLFLPSRSKLWRAESAWQWQEARQAHPHIEIPLQDAFTRLLSRPSPGTPPVPTSSLGSYVLIHALIQHIYLLKQTAFWGLLPFSAHRGVRVEDVEEVSQALRVWTTDLEQHRQARESETGHHAAGLDAYSGGPVEFNSTALLRLAYMRLHTDMFPSRNLESSDHALIASAFSDAPLLVRGPRMHRAVVQAIHALSMLVKMGVSYVARTKSLEWSIELALCNLECAVVLSKWLITLASIGMNEPPLSADERQLLDTLRRMLDETEFAVPVDPSLSGAAVGQTHHASRSADQSAIDGTRLRQFAVAVVRLWAETFKGTHIFEIIRIMGAGLESYADLLEKPRDRTPLGRIAPDAAFV